MAATPTKSIQAIIFDVGGVLYENIQEFFLPDLARRHGLDPDHLLSLGYKHGGAWGLGQATEEEYWRGILSDAGLASELLPGLVTETADYIRSIPETWDVVKALPSRPRLGILSNTTWEWVARLRHVEDWEARFDPIVLSCEVGLCKPDPAIYALLLDRLKLPGEQVLFVDDREDNLAAAAQFGICGHRFSGGSGLRKELEGLGILETEGGI